MSVQLWDLNFDISSGANISVNTQYNADVRDNQSVVVGGSSDYEKLKNLPSINGALIKGAYTLGEGLSIVDKTILLDDTYIKQVRMATTAQWNSEPTYIPDKGLIIVYTDYATYDGVLYSGIKIADGTTYLIDLPFVSGDINSKLNNHISNSSIHVSETDREYWNNKSRVSNDILNEELIITL